MFRKHNHCFIREKFILFFLFLGCSIVRMWLLSSFVAKFALEHDEISIVFSNYFFPRALQVRDNAVAVAGVTSNRHRSIRRYEPIIHSFFAFRPV